MASNDPADTARQLSLAFTAADAAQRIAARHGLVLARVAASSRALDLRRADGKGSVAASDARAALAAAQARLATARGDDERSFVDPIKPADRIATLHGRVHGPDGAGIAGLVVRALGPDDKPRAETKTGDRGYFRLDVPAERTPLPTVEAPHPSPLPRVPLRLVVSDGRRDLIDSKTPTLVRPGHTVYRELEVRRPPQ